MNIYSIAYKNLLRKKTRTALTAGGIMLSTWVLATLLGFNRGYQQGLNRDIDNMGFQVLLTAKGCPYEAATLMLKGGTGLRYMAADVVKTVYKNAEVEKVTPMLMQGVFDPNKGENGAVAAYLGVDADTFPAMKPYLEFKQGGWFRDNAAYEAVLGYEAAELETREVGDKMLIPGVDKEIKVVGVLKRSGTQDDGTIFLPIAAVQKIFAKQGKLTGLGIKVKKDADLTAFENKLYDLPDVQVVSMAQVKTTIMNLVNSARVIVMGIAGIALIIAMAGVINTILMSVMERYAEIGILKSMGAMPLDVFKMIWLETAILCALGGAAGIGLAFTTARLAEAGVRYFLPYAPNGALIALDGGITAFSFALILGGGLLSGVYPAWRAARVRPLEAIRIEGEQ
ncbi:MAG TPA: ABC transporter permease [Elusimicrobiales bacterium]|nr:ABC transporter permease [Elusimicrobiales bacterium]